MGRNRTGITTSEVRRIELSYLLKEGYFRKGCRINGTMSWTEGSNIGIETLFSDDEQYIRLHYTLTDWNEEKHQYDYKVQLVFVPSNLGKGKVPYFQCPESGKRCRILYKAYGSHIWKCRDAYRNTIFYPSQVSSKIYKYCDEYWRLDKEIKCLREEKRFQTHYKGKPTKHYQRLQRLIRKQERADYLRWTPAHMPKVLRDSFPDIEF